MSFNQHCLADKSSKKIVKYINDYLDYLKLDRILFWERFTDKLNSIRLHPEVLVNISNDLINENFYTDYNGIDDILYNEYTQDEFQNRIINAFKYFNKILNKDNRFLGFSGLNNGTITFFKCRMTRSLREQIKRDCLEHLLNLKSNKIIFLDCREISRQLNVLDAHYEYMLDLDKVVENVLSLYSDLSKPLAITEDILLDCGLDEVEVVTPEVNTGLDVSMALNLLSRRFIRLLMDNGLFVEGKLKAKYLGMPNPNIGMFLITKDQENEDLFY